MVVVTQIDPLTGNRVEHEMDTSNIPPLIERLRNLYELHLHEHWTRDGKRKPVPTERPVVFTQIEGLHPITDARVRQIYEANVMEI